MRHIKLDRQDSRIKRFVLSLCVDDDGSILELKGKPVVRVLPVAEKDPAVDKAKVKAAILKRRAQARRLNAEWEAVDKEVWDTLPGTGE